MKRRVAVPVALLLVLVCGACGASARTGALRTSLITLNVARDTVRAASKEREARIVKDAGSKDEGRTQLDAWRATVDKITMAIDDGYDAIWAGALLDDAKSVSAAEAAVAKALALVKDMKNPAAPPKNAPTAKEAKP